MDMPLPRGPRRSNIPREDRSNPGFPVLPYGDMDRPPVDRRIPLPAPDYTPTPPDESPGGARKAEKVEAPERGSVPDLRRETELDIGNVFDR